MHLERNPSLDRELSECLVAVWAAVSNAGGAVGFLPGVGPDDIWPVAAAAFDRVAEGRDDLAVAFDGPKRVRPVGFGFLATNDWLLAGHWASIKRLQSHPEHRGRGVGGALLGELEDAARDRGLERLVLTVRGGTGTEGFYLRHGFTLDARLPGRLRIGAGDVREELVLSKVLDGPTAAPVAGPAVEVTLPVRRLDPTLPLPSYAHPGDAGLDLRARIDVTLAPGERAVVPTGVAVALPHGYAGFVHPRSGLAARHGVTIVNAPGTIDAGYRGELLLVLVNHDPDRAVTLMRGDRVAQLVVQPVATATLIEVAELPGTARGDGGLGSTGS